MKIGIVTIFDNENLGNRLQNFALQEILLDYADEVVTIKNKPYIKDLKTRIIRKSCLAESPGINLLCGKRRKAAILSFNRQYIYLSHKCYCYEQLCEEKIEKCDLCDFYCAGSDQIWNSNIGRNGGFNYLSFSPYNRNFSYAASFGTESIPDKFKKDVAAGLKNLKYISVREDAGKRIVEELTGRTDAEVLIDPTMMYDIEKWNQIAKEPDNMCKERYVLLYFLGGITDSRKQEIQQIALDKGWKIVNILDKASKFYNIGPKEFIYLIKNAELVCTDSFHASVFSFLYDIPLAIYERFGKDANMGSRLQTFVEKFNLERCIVQNDIISPAILTNDYSSGHLLLEKEREKARYYLDHVFNGALA